jgi:hypothetical protein
LFTLFSNKSLNLAVLLSNDPLLSVDLLEQENDLPLVLFLETVCSLVVDFGIFLLNVFDLSFVHLLKFQDSLSDGIVLNDESLHLFFISLFKVFVFLKLALKFGVFVVICSLKLSDLVIEYSNLRNMILFQGIKLYKLLSGLFVSIILKFSFQVIGGSRHEVLHFVLFFFKSDFGYFLFVNQVVGSLTENFIFLDSVFEHDL